MATFTGWRVISIDGEGERREHGTFTDFDAAYKRQTELCRLWISFDRVTVEVEEIDAE